MKLNAPVLAGAAVGWLLAEVVNAHLCRHVDEIGGVRDVVGRHASYAIAICVAAFALGSRATGMHVLLLLLCLATARSLVAVAVASKPVQRWLGVEGPRGVLLVADRWSVADLVSDRSGRAGSFVGVCTVEGDDRSGAVAGVPVLGGPEDVVDLVTRLGIHEVVVRPSPELDGEWLQELAWALERCGARLVVLTGLRDVTAGRVSVSRMGRSVVLSVSQARPTGLVRQLKSVIEAAVAIVGLVVALPVLALCALAVRLDSPGPVFFKQLRVRDGGRTFVMWKIRTMTAEAETLRASLDGCNEVGGGLFKMKADPRVTRVGRILRKLSLDEVPQLLNVIRGEMALIGPRPALPSEVATYDERTRRRLSVKPGLTGLWQVSGRSRLTWAESVALDIDYVDNWSPMRDLAIALSTVRAVTARDGAY